jgi:hypothetical protein
MAKKKGNAKKGTGASIAQCDHLISAIERFVDELLANLRERTETPTA